MGLAALLRAIPVACLVGVSCVLAWDTTGSINADHWLAYAVLAALVLAVVLFSGSAVRPGRLPLVAAALLVGFALWTGAFGGLVTRPVAGTRRRPAGALLRRLPAHAARHAP